MEPLPTKDMRQVLDFLHDLYALREKEAFTSYLISSLPHLIRADAHTYNEMDQARGYASYKLWPKDFTPIKDAQEILGRFSHQIPMLAHWERGDGQALKISDFLSSRAFKKKEIYNEFYRPMRIPFAIGIALAVNRHNLITIAHHRDRKDFTERERTALNLIQPHVSQAFANAEAVTQMHAEVARLNRVMEQIPQGLISIDARGFIQWATTLARELLGEYFGVRTRGYRRLPDLLVRWMRDNQTYLNHTDDAPQRMSPMVIDHGSRQLHVRIVPEGSHSLVFLEETFAEIPVQQLEHLGLSRRETEILGWIVHGKSNPVIATILGISVRTVHRHVEHIYVKLGVENRHAAISLAFEAMQRSGRLGRPAHA